MARVVLVAVLAAVAAGSAHAATRPTCGSYSVGPGTHRAGSAHGATCLLTQFKRCRSASYTLSVFGVDTIATDAFSVANADGHCFVSVQMTNRVVPQQPRPLGTALCSALVAKGTDVVAVNCTGAPAKTISLTGRR